LREKFDGVKLNAGYSIETTDGRTLWQDSIRLSFYFNLKEIKFNIITQIVTATGHRPTVGTTESQAFGEVVRLKQVVEQTPMNYESNAFRRW